MKVIDNKGRLFGLINYIDLVITLLLIAVVGTFLVTGIDNDSNNYSSLGEETDEKITIKFFIQGIRDVSVESVNIEDIFKNADTGNVFGKVVSKETQPATMITSDQNGNAIEAKVPGRYNMILTLECSGTVSNSEIKINDQEIHIGKFLTLKSKLNKFQGIIFGIKY